LKAARTERKNLAAKIGIENERLIEDDNWQAKWAGTFAVPAHSFNQWRRQEAESLGGFCGSM